MVGQSIRSQVLEAFQNFKYDDMVDDKAGHVEQSKTMRGKNKCK